MKNKILKLTVLFFLFVGLFLLVYHNDTMYQRPIMKILDIKEIKRESSTNSLGLKEIYYYEEISGILLNTKNKGKKVNIKYERAFSSVVTEKYKVGDKVFIENDSIEGLKRDYYVVGILLLFTYLMIVVGSLKGFLAVITVAINSFIVYASLELYFKGMNLLFLSTCIMILLTIISILIINGRNKKTLAIILSVFSSMTILFLFTFIVGKCTNYSGVNLNEFGFLTVPVEDVLLPSLLIGGLGAVMDIAVSIVASVSELIEKEKNITKHSLLLSCKEIGSDIMGPMLNVIFFTYLCSGLPIFVLAIRNGFSFYNYLVTNFSLELTRFLVGGIGIVLSIPISIFITIYTLKRGDRL